VSPRPVAFSGALVALTFLAGCASSRGWGRGRYVSLVDDSVMQVRRSRQVRDPKTGDVVASWVGARAIQDGARIVECELTLYVDADGNGKPEAGEIVAQRSSREPSTKILFDDVRVRDADAARGVQARFDARTERRGRTVTWRFAAD